MTSGSISGLNQPMSAANVQQTIAIKVIKDELTRQQEIISNLVLNNPVEVIPKGNNSTFEYIV